MVKRVKKRKDVQREQEERRQGECKSCWSWGCQVAERRESSLTKDGTTDDIRKESNTRSWQKLDSRMLAKLLERGRRLSIDASEKIKKPVFSLSRFDENAPINAKWTNICMAGFASGETAELNHGEERLLQAGKGGVKDQ